jgi:2-polyprenyl-6-methoxyphenol hydroxylase-like FAD-dependent oxidoreductase
MSWGRLHGLLRNVLPDACYVAGAEFVRLEQDRDEVRAYFADGRMQTADLLIAADGSRSTVRAQLWPEIRPVYAGYVGWRGLVEEADLSPEAHAALFERFAFLLPPGEQMLGYPVTGPNDAVELGRRRYNFVWYRPVDETRELPRLLTDAAGRYHPEGIPPPLIRREVLAELNRAAEALLSRAFAEIVRIARQPFFQAIVDLESARLALGRVVLLGDAAFVARPHCGMGVTKAAGDAVALTRALKARSGDISAALARYETERLRFGHFIVDHARRLGSFMKTNFASPEERQLAGTYSTPGVIMREFAVPPALPWLV